MLHRPVHENVWTAIVLIGEFFFKFLNFNICRIEMSILSLMNQSAPGWYGQFHTASCKIRIYWLFTPSRSSYENFSCTQEFFCCLYCQFVRSVFFFFSVSILVLSFHFVVQSFCILRICSFVLLPERTDKSLPKHAHSHVQNWIKTFRYCVQ